MIGMVYPNSGCNGLSVRAPAALQDEVARSTTRGLPLVRRQTNFERIPIPDIPRCDSMRQTLYYAQPFAFIGGTCSISVVRV